MLHFEICDTLTTRLAIASTIKGCFSAWLRWLLFTTIYHLPATRNTNHYEPQISTIILNDNQSPASFGHCKLFSWFIKSWEFEAERLRWSGGFLELWPTLGMLPCFGAILRGENMVTSHARALVTWVAVVHRKGYQQFVALSLNNFTQLAAVTPRERSQKTPRQLTQRNNCPLSHSHHDVVSYKPPRCEKDMSIHQLKRWRIFCAARLVNTGGQSALNLKQWTD